MNQRAPEPLTRDAKTRVAESVPGLPSEGRRRLFRGVGGAGGVLLAVSAKTALGGTVCQSPSAAMSGNTSPRPGSGSTCTGGQSPGYWCSTQCSSHWSTAHGAFPTFTSPLKTTGTALTFSCISNHGTTLQSLFPGWVPSGTTSSISIWWVLYAPNDPMFGGSGPLLADLVAAWLNAGYYTGSGAKYPLTQTQVVNIWTQLHTGMAYCPTSFGSCSKAWTPTQVKAYLEGMYATVTALPSYCT